MGGEGTRQAPRAVLLTAAPMVQHRMLSLPATLDFGLAADALG
jgi:hypothetical protein